MEIVKVRPIIPLWLSLLQRCLVRLFAVVTWLAHMPAPMSLMSKWDICAVTVSAHLVTCLSSQLAFGGSTGPMSGHHWRPMDNIHEGPELVF